MYADLAHIEVSLHSKIRFALEQAYGSGKREWWLRLLWKCGTSAMSVAKRTA